MSQSFLVRLAGEGIILKENPEFGSGLFGLFCTRRVDADSSESAVELVKLSVYRELTEKLGSHATAELKLTLDEVWLVRWGLFRKAPRGFTFFAQEPEC